MRIIADCYAATHPDERLWRMYLTEIEKLQKSGEATAEDCYLLRHSLEAKSALMEVTLGEEAAFTEGTVPEILQMIREQVQSGVRLQLREEEGLRKRAELQVQAAEAKAQDQLASIRRRASKWAHSAVMVLQYLSLAALLVGSASSLPWGFPQFRTAWAFYALSIVQFVVLIASVSNLTYGVTLRIALRKLELILSGAIERQLRSVVGL